MKALFSHRIQPGFSLIELLVCLGIISLLSLMSYPLFTHLILRAHRLEAKAALLRTAEALENYYADHSSYAGATLAKLNIPDSTEGGHYQLQLDSGDQAYLIRALPKGMQTQDSECDEYSLNHLGQRGSGGNTNDCW